MDLQPCHMLQQFLGEVNVEVGQLKALDVGLGNSVSLLTLPHPHHQRELSNTAPGSSPSATAGKRQGQLFHSHTLWTGSLTPLLPGPALLCCPGKMQDLLS